MKKLLVIATVIGLAALAADVSVTVTTILPPDQKGAVKFLIRSLSTATNSPWFGVTDPTTAQIKAYVETNASVKVKDFILEAKRVQINAIAQSLSLQSFDGLTTIAAITKYWPPEMDLNITKMNLITNIVNLMQSANATKLTNAAAALQ
jgi:hypothetical protein